MVNEVNQANMANQVLDTKQPVIEEQKPKPKLLKFVLIVVLAFVFVGGGVLIVKNWNKTITSEEALSPTPYLPPADPRIKVDLKPLDSGKTVELTISNFPDDIYTIEYELTYRSDQKQEGIFGSIKIQNNEKEVKRELTLGTCSSGKCVYHHIVGDKGLLTLKFTGKSGASRFQKEYTLL